MDGWIHIISDLSIFIAYFSIPFMLLIYLRRKDLGNIKWIAVLFVAFIALCGLTHALDALIFWVPLYRLSGFLKFLTGTVSIGTAIVLAYAIPEALKFKSPTEMKSEIDERMRLQELLELFVKNSHGAIAMFDNDMRYLMVNKNWVTDYGVSRNDLIGHSHYEIFPEIDRMQEWKDFHQRALQGETIENKQDSFFHNGQEIFLRWKLNPWHKSSGEIGGIIMFTEVITESVILKRELNKTLESKERQNELLESLSHVAKIGTWRVDIVNNSLEWSPTVYDIHEVSRNHKISLEKGIEFYHPEDIGIIQHAVEEGMKNGTSWDQELRIITGKGTTKWVRAIGRPVIENGKPTEIHGLFQDINLQKKSEELLNRSNKELEEMVRERTNDLELVNKELEAFTYSVSHDLRAPLRAINGFSEALTEDFTESLPPDGIRYLDRIIKNSQKMGALIDDLLEFSHMNRKKERIRNIHTHELVTNIINSIFSEHEAIIHLKELPNIQGDESMIQQVFQNLISNAIKYSSKEEKQEVEIGGYVEDEKVTIYFKDNGVGFDTRHADKLFGIFQRLHGENEFEGTGVGLALCHKIIERHNGQIWADSKLGEGSTFYISLKHTKENGG